MREIQPHTTLKSYVNAEPKGYQGRLQEFINRESTAEEQSTENRIQDSTIDEIKRNDNIPFLPDATIVTDYGSSIIFQTDTGDESPDNYIQRKFGIYAEDKVMVLCYDGDDDEEFAEYRGTVSKLKNNSLTIELDIENHEREPVKSAISASESIGIARTYSPLIFHREERALAKLPGKSSLWEVITGERALKFEATDRENSERFDKLLYGNERQRKAIQKSLSASDVCCIQGPPGTGKTRVIVELIRRFAEAGRKVLVTTETNTALDNILMGSGERPSETSLLGRIGGFETSQDIVVGRKNHGLSGREYILQYGAENPRSAQVMFSTNNSAHHLAKQYQEYDIVICDEAAQARKTSTFIPLQLADRAIFVGDHKQLAATRQSQKLDSGVDRRHESVFSHLYGGLYPEEIGVQLDTQFRMVPELVRFSSEQFYDGSIKTGTSHESSPSQPIGLINLDVNRGERSLDTSKQNQLEATAVAGQVRSLIDRYYEPDEIGVIAAYSAQEELIRWQLENLPGDDTDQVQVATIDRFQGSEKKAIVVSFTRSNQQGNVGFLSGEDGPNRLNVALTRAQEYCALIGDWDTLREGDQLYDALYRSVTDRFNHNTRTKDDLENLTGMLARH